MNILITCIGRRHYLASFFKDIVGERGRVVGCDMSFSAPGLAACDRSYVMPAVGASHYLDELIKICISEEISYVFSVNDLELQLLADNRESLERATGSVFVVSTPEVIGVCADKLRTYMFAVANGIPAPLTFASLAEAVASLEQKQCRFPLMVKPRWGSGSVGLFKVNSLSELNDAFVQCDLAVRSSHLNSLGDPSAAVVVQEFIDGDEYGVDVLNSLSGDLVGFAAKRKLSMRAGETDKAITVDGSPFSAAVKTISAELGHIGNLDCDFLVRDGVVYLLELNPRFGGGYPFTHHSGANHIHLLLNGQGTPLEYNYAVGRTFAKCDILVEV